MLTQAIEDVCSTPAALISVMAGPEDPEGPGSPNCSSPTPKHGFSIDRVNQTYRAILQVPVCPDLLCCAAQHITPLIRDHPAGVHDCRDGLAAALQNEALPLVLAVKRGSVGDV